MVIRIINGTEIITYKGRVYGSIRELLTTIKGSINNA
jgi:hypothetical protein